MTWSISETALHSTQGVCCACLWPTRRKARLKKTRDVTKKQHMITIWSYWHVLLSLLTLIIKFLRHLYSKQSNPVSNTFSWLRCLGVTEWLQPMLQALTKFYSGRAWAAGDTRCRVQTVRFWVPACLAQIDFENFEVFFRIKSLQIWIDILPAS